MDWENGCREVANLLAHWRPDARYIDVRPCKGVVYFDLHVPGYEHPIAFHWLMTNIKLNLYRFYQGEVIFAYFREDYEQQPPPSIVEHCPRARHEITRSPVPISNVVYSG